MNNKKKVGIAFSTRNRPDTLEICLRETFRFLSPEKYDYHIVVVEDNSNPEYVQQYIDLLFEVFPRVHSILSGERLGIAKSKNKCLKMLKDSSCDYFFLFDDDAFPKAKGWDEYYIETAKANNVHHLMHQHPLPGGFNPHRIENGIAEYGQSCGVCLFFTRHAVETIGGYNPGFGIYGFEHSNQSLRANAAGLQPGFSAYISPEKTRDYIYSLDLDLNNWGVHPPEFEVKPEQWRSSIQGEPINQYINYNGQFFGQINPGYQEL